jgi:DNA-binding IclR family transcriptional regulator
MSPTGKYRAPALQKGLEILELLAGSPVQMLMSDISAALGRSVSEIFRMLQVLEEHGYIARSGEGYRLTNRLFSLGMAQPPVRDLLAHAAPVMQELAREAGQSCHLAVASGADMVVVTSVETPGLMGFAVRMGYRRPLVRSASGHILLGFQKDAVRDAMLRDVESTDVAFDRMALLARLAEVREAGTIAMASPMLTAITDLSAPILRAESAVAALTMPFVDGPAASLPRDDAIETLRKAARRVSEALSTVP